MAITISPTTVLTFNDSTTAATGGNVTATGAWTIPVGTTAQRPSGPATGMMRYNTTLGYAEYYALGNWWALGTVPSVPITYLVIGGGGNGGSAGVPAPGNPAVGGGGGAGGVLQGSATLSPGTVYTATVGAAGNSSVFNGLTALGGGNGGSAGGSGSNGASGGGGSNGPGGTATQGYNGGYGFVNGGGDNGGCGGGGGGSTAVGAAGSTNFVNYYYGGAGGAGTTSSITGTAVTYAGGGGGGGIHPPNYAAGTGGAGGSGGGGGGAGFTGGTGGAATNYGSGGGGGAGGTNAGGAGYQGVVIISVPTVLYTGITTGSPTVTTSGSNTILRYASSGSYTA